MGTQVRVDETRFRTEMARNGFKKVIEFEVASGIPRATLDNMISGRNVPNQRTIQAVYDALPNSSASDLFAIFFRHDLHEMQGSQLTKGDEANGTPQKE